MLNNEKILAVRSGCLGCGSSAISRLRSSELRSLVYYVRYDNIGLINCKKNILRFYSEDLVLK